MTGNGHIEIGEFKSCEQLSKPLYGRERSVFFKRSGTKRTKKPRSGGVSRGGVMLIKLGVCAGICALFALLKVLNIPTLNKGLDVVGSALDENDNDDTLGKLKFVELPGILEVFAGGDTLTQPIKYKTAKLDDTNTCLTLTGDKNAQVTVCSNGRIKSIGDDKSYGKYIIVNHENDVEITYYGFDTVSVDEGQPVNKLDTLGRLTDDGVLRLILKQNGAPKNPCDYLGIKPAV